MPLLLLQEQMVMELQRWGGKRGSVGGQKLHFDPGTKVPATLTIKGMKLPGSKTSSKGSRVTIHTESKSMFS